MKPLILTLAASGLVAASFSIASAQPYYLAGDYNNWSNNGNPMTGGPTQFDYTITGQTPGAYGELKVTDGSWNNTWPSKNLKVKYDTNGSATIHFYPGTPNDGWLPLANRLGYEDPGNLTWGVAGGFNGWDGTQALLASIGNGAYSNNLTVATAGTFGFKFQSPPGSWNDIFFGSDFGNGGGDGTYTTANSPESVPVVLDLPQGRYRLGNVAPTPVTNQVVFAVDMTYQIQSGYFQPGSMVFVAGTFNGWPGPATGTFALSNDPPYNGGRNTNIYYGTNTFVELPFARIEYKFNQNDLAAQNSGWENINNRILTIPATSGMVMLPVVAYNDAYPSDVLSQDTPVLFTVDMSNAIAVTADKHVFDPATDDVYVNGAFAGWYPWAGGINPAPADPMYQLFRQGQSLLYANTIVIPKGTPVSFEYKYGIDPNRLNGGPSDDEAGQYQNHRRVVRATALNPYAFATDTFGSMYGEPLFSSSSTDGGQLTVGAPVGGTVPVTWLGRPGAHLQVNSTLSGGTWQDLMETDGATWTTGNSSTNGFVSLTNWPAADKAFFRLAKP